MEDKEGDFSCFDFLLNFWEAGLEVVDKEELSLLLVLFAFSHDVAQDIDFFLAVLIVGSVVKGIKILPHLLVGLYVRTHHVVAERNILEEVGLGQLID